MNYITTGGTSQQGILILLRMRRGVSTAGHMESGKVGFYHIISVAGRDKIGQTKIVSVTVSRAGRPVSDLHGSASLLLANTKGGPT